MKDIKGFYSGPKIRNFEMTAALVREHSVNLGKEVIMQSKLIGRCHSATDVAERFQCKNYLPASAEILLYELQPIGKKLSTDDNFY